jgi:hypothetical protein
MKLGFIIMTHRLKKCPKSGNMVVLNQNSFGSAGKDFVFVFWNKDGVL